MRRVYARARNQSNSSFGSKESHLHMEDIWKVYGLSPVLSHFRGTSGQQTKPVPHASYARSGALLGSRRKIRIDSASSDFAGTSPPFIGGCRFGASSE